MAARQVGDEPRLYDTHKAAVCDLNLGPSFRIGQAMHLPYREPVAGEPPETRHLVEIL
jgi:hypothetical protein